MNKLHDKELKWVQMYLWITQYSLKEVQIKSSGGILPLNKVEQNPNPFYMIPQWLCLELQWIFSWLDALRTILVNSLQSNDASGAAFAFWLGAPEMSNVWHFHNIKKCSFSSLRQRGASNVFRLLLGSQSLCNPTQWLISPSSCVFTCGAALVFMPIHKSGHSITARVQ